MSCASLGVMDRRKATERERQDKRVTRIIRGPRSVEKGDEGRKDPLVIGLLLPKLRWQGGRCVAPASASARLAEACGRGLSGMCQMADEGDCQLASAVASSGMV